MPLAFKIRVSRRITWALHHQKTLTLPDEFYELLCQGKQVSMQLEDQGISSMVTDDSHFDGIGGIMTVTTPEKLLHGGKSTRSV